MSTTNGQGEHSHSTEVEARRRARDNRAFRPAALARRGRVSALAEALAPPRRAALAALWLTALALGALGFALVSSHLDLRDLVRAPSVGR